MRRRPTLLDDYFELRESGSTSDFPAVLGNVMYRKMLEWAKSVPDRWRKYVHITEAPDKRPQTSIIGYEAEDLLPIPENGAYIDSALGDASFQWQLGTYGRAFSINRDVILNDDLGYIRQQPRRFGRASARTLSKFAAQTLLEGNGATFDGTALFHTTHSNLDTGAGSAFSSGNLQKAIIAMRNQTVLGVFHSTEPKNLLIPPSLEFTARQLLNSTIIVAVGVPASNEVQQIGNQNVMNGMLDILIEPFLTSSTAYYVLGDKDDTPILLLGFLNGKQTPDLLIEKPTMHNVAGGDDEWEYEFDMLRYKVRHDWGGATALFWGAYKFAGT
jgi:hypothetical protein